MKTWLYLSSVLLAGAIAPLWAAQPAPKPPATVGDLPKRAVEVHTNAVVSGGSSKAMESYRHFLELQNTYPKLRAEAIQVSAMAATWAQAIGDHLEPGLPSLAGAG